MRGVTKQRERDFSCCSHPLRPGSAELGHRLLCSLSDGATHGVTIVDDVRDEQGEPPQAQHELIDELIHSRFTPTDVHTHPRNERKSRSPHTNPNVAPGKH